MYQKLMEVMAKMDAMESELKYNDKEIKSLTSEVKVKMYV
jgi:hypothetical protein